jgi:hypothetical protein
MEESMKPQRMTKAQKLMERAVTRAYAITFNGLPVLMTDIPAIYREIELAIEQASHNPENFAELMKVIRGKYVR